MKKGQGLPWGPRVADRTQHGKRKRFKVKGSEGTVLELARLNVRNIGRRDQPWEQGGVLSRQTCAGPEDPRENVRTGGLEWRLHGQRIWESCSSWFTWVPASPS